MLKVLNCYCNGTAIYRVKSTVFKYSAQIRTVRVALLNSEVVLMKVKEMYCTNTYKDI